ncbi:MAG: hypothetical protein ACHQEM_02940 [Chitinophagales bacterium]
MGHFIIDLPENRKGDVRWGTVFKKHFSLFKSRKNESWSKTGYIVKITGEKNHSGYRLFRSKNGEWSTDEDGNKPLNNEFMLSIQKAIIDKEKELAKQ